MDVQVEDIIARTKRWLQENGWAGLMLPEVFIDADGGTGGFVDGGPYDDDPTAYVDLALISADEIILVGFASLEAKTWTAAPPSDDRDELPVWTDENGATRPCLARLLVRARERFILQYRHALQRYGMDEYAVSCALIYTNGEIDNLYDINDDWGEAFLTLIDIREDAAFHSAFITDPIAPDDSLPLDVRHRSNALMP